MRRAARLTVSRAVALSSGPRPTQLETASASGSGSTRRSAIDLLSLHPPSRRATTIHLPPQATPGSAAFFFAVSSPASFIIFSLFHGGSGLGDRLVAIA